MKNLFFGALLLAFLANAQAQNQQRTLDSLKKAAAKNNDLKTYNAIALIFYQQRKLDSVLFYFQKALANPNDKKFESQARRNYGWTYLNYGFSALAQEQFFKALKIAFEQKDSTQIALSYFNLGAVARSANLYDRAIQYYDEGLKFSTNDGVEIAIKNELGQALTQKKDFYKAVSVFQDILPKMKANPSGAVYNSVGNTFIEFNNYDSAYKYATLALSLAESTHDSSGVMWNKQLLGKYYFGTKQFTKAKTFFHSALGLNEAFGNDSFDWTAVELPKLYQLLNTMYTSEHKTDSLLWLKGEEIILYRRLWEEQKKRAAEFVFNSQENDVKVFLQKENQSRKRLSQYYAIALVLLICILAYFILSGRDSQRRYSPFISIVVLVFLFEFLLVVLDPLIGRITNDEPLYKFIINVLVALLLLPVHFFGEWLLKRFALDIRIKKVG